jgi:hypothetical protein
MTAFFGFIIYSHVLILGGVWLGWQLGAHYGR